MKLKEGMRVCVSVSSLLEKFDELLFGIIVPTFEADADYYDLFNEDGELACLDGEEVMIEQVGQELVTFRNDNGDGSIHFTLTHEEARTAIFAYRG